MYLYTVYICMWNSGGHILEKMWQCWEINGNIWKYDMWNKINIEAYSTYSWYILNTWNATSTIVG